MLGVGISGTGVSGGRSLTARIRAFFSNGEQGVWYDPSDLTTLYQDAAGTTPVTAMEQPVGLMLDKSKGLGPELVTNGDFSQGVTGWTTGTGWSISNELVGSSVPAYTVATTAISVIAGKSYEVQYTVTSFGSGQVRANFIGGTQVNGIGRTAVGSYREVLVANTGNTLLAIGSGGTGFTGSVDNISVRELTGNHAYQTTSASRPVLSARVNMLTNTPFVGAVAGSPGTFPTGWSVVFNTGTLDSVSSERLTLSASGTRWVVGQSLTFAANTTYEARFTLHANTGVVVVSQLFTWNQAIGATETIFVNGVLVNGQTYIPVAGDAIVCRLASGVNGGTATVRFGLGCINTATGTVTISQPDIRPTNAGVNLPPYQWVNTPTDYDTAGFPQREYFDGVDDAITTAAGGGGTTAFFFCASINVAAVGVVQTLISDTGTNTGYRVRINASNQLELSAGNGSAYTTATTAGTVSAGQTYVVTCWHDGANLNAQINNGTAAQQAFATATAGTAAITVGKNNGAASSYFKGSIYEAVYLKDTILSSSSIGAVKRYCAKKGMLTL